MDSELSTSASNSDNDGHQGQIGGHQKRYSTSYNCARNFYENHDVVKHCLPIPIVCKTCQASLFKKETRGLCCRHGAIVLPKIPVPDELLHLFDDQSAEGKLFRENIRSYNHIFAFTSISISLDENLANAQQGVYTFRAHGEIYRKIGNLLMSLGDCPRFLQLYIYDIEHEIENRLLENESLDRSLLEKIKQILNVCNPFVFRFGQLAQQPDLENCRLVIKEQCAERRQYSLPTISQVAAILIGLDDMTEVTTRDIIVQTIRGHLLTVKEYYGYYDPLQLPFAHMGGIKIIGHIPIENLLHIRRDPSIFLRAGRLLQQYCVDNYVKIEIGRFRWISTRQKDRRSDLYQGLQDCLTAGKNNAGNVGDERMILLSSITGGRRDMYQRYLNAMVVVQKYEKPDKVFV
ncbi:hypothetical protein LIER_36229 [Lithospermum erythrorhizon]|uniref:Helitron helicase-like domain-containing protein n=1 Tax=Lithospermum erythrorhizon TaxID=34254 RepID=A0AAV3P2S2_LITER